MRHNQKWYFPSLGGMTHICAALHLPRIHSTAALILKRSGLRPISLVVLPLATACVPLSADDRRY